MSFENKLSIVLNEEPASQKPAFAEEVFAYPDPLAEYFFYVAGDAASATDMPEEMEELRERLTQRGFPEKFNRINLFTAKVFFKVETLYDDFDISMHRDYNSKMSQATGVDTIDLYLKTMGLADMNLDECTEKYPRLHGGMVRESIGEGWNADVQFLLNQGEKSCIRWEYSKVSPTRALVIRAQLRASEFTFGEVHRHWKSLVAKYENMPPNKFTGAERF